MADERYVVMMADDAIAQGFREALHQWDDGIYCVLVDTREKRVVYEDGGEPEDMVLYRDLQPLVDELNRLASEKPHDD